MSDLAVPPPVAPAHYTRVAHVARLTAKGWSAAAIADALGCSLRRVSDLQYDARQRGLLPGREVFQGARYQTLRAKGAAPRFGRVLDITNALAPSHVKALLTLARPEDATIAQTIARVLAEALDARKE